MSPRPEQPHAVRRVVLPSGKTIEVVYFADSEGGQVANAPTADSAAPPGDGEAAEKQAFGGERRG